MAIRKILRVGDPRLRMESEPIPENEITSKEIKDLIKDMYQTMKDANGLGLAAPQIGELKQVIVIGYDENERYADAPMRMDYKALINPVITPQKSELHGFWEGCLSVPDMRGFVERVREIKMEWFDVKGKKHSEIIEGFDAVVYQHECDHLKGILYIDRLKDPKMFGYNEELDSIDSQPQ